MDVPHRRALRRSTECIRGGSACPRSFPGAERHAHLRGWPSCCTPPSRRSSEGVLHRHEQARARLARLALHPLRRSDGLRPDLFRRWLDQRRRLGQRGRAGRHGPPAAPASPQRDRRPAAARLRSPSAASRGLHHGADLHVHDHHDGLVPRQQPRSRSRPRRLRLGPRLRRTQRQRARHGRCGRHAPLPSAPQLRHGVLRRGHGGHRLQQRLARGSACHAQRALLSQPAEPLSAVRPRGCRRFVGVGLVQRQQRGATRHEQRGLHLPRRPRGSRRRTRVDTRANDNPEFTRTNASGARENTNVSTGVVGQLGGIFYF